MLISWFSFFCVVLLNLFSQFIFICSLQRSQRWHFRTPFWTLWQEGWKFLRSRHCRYRRISCNSISEADYPTAVTTLWKWWSVRVLNSRGKCESSVICIAIYAIMNQSLIPFMMIIRKMHHLWNKRKNTHNTVFLKWSDFFSCIHFIGIATILHSNNRIFLSL